MAGAGIHIDVTVQDQEVRAGLARLLAKVANPAPALMEIGEELIISTRKTLDSGHGPNGEAWPANSATTLERKLGKIQSKKSNVTKPGGLSARGRRAHGLQKVLFETGALHDRLAKQLVDGGHGILVGTNEPYGAAQQFGNPGNRMYNSPRGHPAPIPPRVWLGVSPPARAQILTILGDYLLR